MKRNLLAAVLLAAVTAVLAAPSPAGADRPRRFDTVLYGASYYWEYMPTERLEKDVALMEKAGINFLRVGESSWGVLEPADGVFDFGWLRRVLDRVERAGIKVILGTPTYSIPAWLYREHPEIQVKQMNQPRYTYGLRQMTDMTHPVYRRYAERIIRRLVAEFRDHPAVIGYQLDNESHPSGTADARVQAAFRERLRRKFGTPETLDKAWGLNYWGQRIASFDDLPPREGALNPGYKLEWERFEQDIAADFLAWQAKIVRELKRPDQFVTHDFVGGFPGDVDPAEVAASLDLPAVNVYMDLQDEMDGQFIAYCGDIQRSLKGGNYLVTETTAQTTGWDSRSQFPPYDGQLRLAAYADILSGADLVAYWHWHSLHYGQETYWKGVLGHDLEPGRVYDEVSRIAHELKRVGPALAGLKKRNRVAILYSLDSRLGLEFMPFDANAGYMTVLDQMYRALYRRNVETDFVFPGSRNLSDYALVFVPPLYVASDELLVRLADYVKGGGHVLMAFKSGFVRRELDRALDDHARAAPRGVRLPLPGVHEPPGPARAQWRPVQGGRGELRLGLGRIPRPGRGGGAGLVRPPGLRPLPRRDTSRLREGKPDLRRNASLRRPAGEARGRGSCRSGDRGRGRRPARVRPDEARRSRRRGAGPRLLQFFGQDGDLSLPASRVRRDPERPDARTARHPDPRAMGPRHRPRIGGRPARQKD